MISNKSVQPQPYILSARSQGKLKIVQMHNRYQIDSQCPVFQDIEYLLKCLTKKQLQKPKDNLLQVTQYTYFATFQFLLQKIDPAHERCCICQFQYQTNYNFEEEVTKYLPTDIICTGRCQHLFHKECMQQFVGKNQFMKCPVCSVIYGVITGDQPDGTMTVSKTNGELPGHKGCGTITVSYELYAGKTKNGVNHGGTSRIGYLPDNEAGRRVLQLLEISWKRKLTFTVGRSVTTGMDNVIVWNGIHHKTSINGGSAHFGYPDPTYLLRVTQELAAKGVVL